MALRMVLLEGKLLIGCVGNSPPTEEGCPRDPKPPFTPLLSCISWLTMTCDSRSNVLTHNTNNLLPHCGDKVELLQVQDPTATLGIQVP